MGYMYFSPVLNSSKLEFYNVQNIFVRHFAPQSIVRKPVERGELKSHSFCEQSGVICLYGLPNMSSFYVTHIGEPSKTLFFSPGNWLEN